jgi:hypothetical protein
MADRNAALSETPRVVLTGQIGRLASLLPSAGPD